MHLTTQAIVLRGVNYRESDKLLTLLTRDNGKMTVIARAGRKKGGGISAAAQLLAWSEMTLAEYRGRWTLQEASTEMEFRHLREDLEKMALASYFAELTERVTLEEVSAPEVLSLLLNALYALDTSLAPLGLVKAVFELRLLTLTGYAPALEGCARCGKEPERPLLHLREGVLHCAECPQPAGVSLPLDAAVLAAMRYITGCSGKKLFSFRLSERAQTRLGEVSEAFLLTQLERGFATLDFYKSLRIGGINGPQGAR